MCNGITHHPKLPALLHVRALRQIKHRCAPISSTLRAARFLRISNEKYHIQTPKDNFPSFELRFV